MNKQQLNQDNIKYRSSTDSVSRRPHRGLLPFLLVLAATVSACTSNTQIGFGTPNSINRVNYAAILPNANSCQAPTQGLVARFLFTAANSIVKEGAKLDSPLKPNEINLDFTNVKYATFDYTASSQSEIDTTITLDKTPKFLAAEQWEPTDLDKRTSLFALLIEHSASTDGTVPGGGIYSDSAPPLKKRTDGTAASDGGNNRKNIINIITKTLEQLSETLTQEKTAKPLAGYYTFSDKLESAATGSTPEFTTAYEVISEKLSDKLKNNPTPEKAAVLEKLKELADKMKNFKPTSGQTIGNKTILLVVDGPDDTGLRQTGIDNLIKEIRDAGVRVFILHSDGAVASPTDILPFPNITSYRDKQSTSCNDTNQCLSFETCALEHLSSGGTSTNKYCFVHRNNRGQTGPLPYYARIACETGGGYIYTNEKFANIKQEIYSWVPYANYALWEQPISGNLASTLNNSTEATIIKGSLGGTVQSNFNFIKSQFQSGYAKSK